jgi:mono/diheme cytochrome c family protein
LPFSFCLVLGCQQQMAQQPSFRPLRPSKFFEDGRSARPLVEGTVPRGHLRDDAHLYTGKNGVTSNGTQAAGAVAASSTLLGGFAAGPALTSAGLAIAGDPFVYDFPAPVTQKVLERGREQYTIFCAVCHDRVGTGDGMIVQRGFTRPPSFHHPRLRQARVGYYFDVITNGLGAMPDYAAQVPPEDRWAIIAYVRVLQYSQSRTVQDLPAEVRQRLEREAK